MSNVHCTFLNVYLDSACVPLGCTLPVEMIQCCEPLYLVRVVNIAVVHYSEIISIVSCNCKSCFSNGVYFYLTSVLCVGTACHVIECLQQTNMRLMNGCMVPRPIALLIFTCTHYYCIIVDRNTIYCYNNGKVTYTRVVIPHYYQVRSIQQSVTKQNIPNYRIYPRDSGCVRAKHHQKTSPPLQKTPPQNNNNERVLQYK